MSSIKVSELAAKTTPVGTEELLINDSGTSKKITKANITQENFTTALKTKVDGIETGATADQTGAEIKTAYEAEANTNAFTDADHTKLDGIETGATADQTGAEIKTAYEGELNTNAYTDAEKTKLAGVADSANNYVHPTGAGNEHLPATVSQTEAGYLDGVTSAIQTQLDGKEPADATIVKDADIGVTVQAYDATIVVDADIGTTVQGYDVDTVKADVTRTFTISQRGTLTTDNDGSFDLNATNNFKCTPTANFTLTFTNIASQSGFILLVNTGGHTVSAAATTKVDANMLATVSTAGTYLLSYFSDGTNVYMTNSLAYT